MSKVKTTLSFESNMLQKLRDMSASKGMDMSSYIAHLLLMEEERILANARMEMIIKKTMPKGFKDIMTLAQLIQNKGDE